ncbi:MAG TPA: hypothetical protein DCM87_02025 [Planctomycetes bacterium]|nr:hypothetical protein [Planctomycetota bacterium]
MKRPLAALAAGLLACGGAVRAAGVEGIARPREALQAAGFVSQRADRTVFNYDNERDPAYVYLALLGNARLETTRVVFRADRLLFVYYLNPRKVGVTHPFVIYAEGNVIVGPGSEYEYGPEPFLSAEALLYDGRLLQGLAVNTTLRVRNVASLDEQNLPATLMLVARELRFRGKVGEVQAAGDKARVGFHYFSGRDITVSTCDLSTPHWGLQCGSVEVVEEEDSPGEYTIRPRGQYLSIANRRILPLPPANLSTRHFRAIPLTRLRAGKSGRFGYNVRTAWDLGRIPGTSQLLRGIRDATGVPVRAELLVDGFAKRGVGAGAEIRYGSRPRRWLGRSWKNMAGELRLYGIHDTGDDRRQDELFAPHSPGEWRAEDRYRLRYFHRQQMPLLGFLDAEVAKWRDRNFYKEFFQHELYGEHAPETYVQWRREFSNTVLASVLYAPRVNEFESAKEYLPEGRLELFPQRITDAAGPTIEGMARAGNLRYLPDAEFDPDGDSFRTARYHAEGAAALPFGAGRYLRLRPYYAVRGTYYEHRWSVPGDAERVVQEGGASAGTQIWRNYPVRSAWLGINGIRHVVVPEVTYANAFYSSRDRGEFYQFDSIDALDRLQYLELALATYLLGRRERTTPGVSGAIERLLELRARTRYYPNAARDNRHGGDGRPMNWSNVHLDLFTDLVHRNITIGVEAEIDTERGKGFEALSPYIVLRLPGRLVITAGDLFLTGDRALGRKESNYFWADLDWNLSDVYMLSAYYRYDFARGTTAEQFYGISRTFDCVTFQMGIEIDDGDNDVRYVVQAMPAGFRSRPRP